MESSVDTIPSEKWIRKRRTTMRIFFVEMFYLGVEYSVFILTVWAYIKDMLKVKDMKILYSVTTSAYLASAIGFGVIIGNIVDKYRCIRIAVWMSNAFIIVGNIIYALPFVPALPILGRLIAGFGAPLKSIIIGEIARSYPPDELSSKFAAIGLAFGSGFIGGPAINLGFTKTNFYLGEWHITKANVTGVYMAVIFIILQIAAFFSVHDLSKEFDLKQIFEKSNTNKRLLHCNENETPKTEKIESLWSYLNNLNALFILFLSFFFLYTVSVYDMLIPMITNDILHWSLFSLNLIIFGLSITAISLMIGISCKPLSETAFYTLIPCALVVLALTQLLLNFIIILHNHTKLVICLWVAAILIFPIVTIAKEIFLPTAFANMIPSMYQTRAESYRQGIGRVGDFAALMTAPFLLKWFGILTVVIVLLCVASIVIYFSRVKCFQKRTK